MKGIENIDLTRHLKESSHVSSASKEKIKQQLKNLSKIIHKETAKKADDKFIKQTVEEANDLMNRLDTKLEFSVDDSTNDTIVKIINKEKDELIRQIPPEEVLYLRQKLHELVGIIYDKEI